MVDWAGRLVPYPQADVERYRSLGLWGESPIAVELHAVALEHPRRTAVVTTDDAVTYAALDERSDRLAAGLHDLGLEPGGRVVVQLTNRLETVVAWYGLLKAGLVPVCTLAAHREHEIGSISRKVDAVAHLVEHSPAGFDLVAFGAAQTGDHPTMRQLLTQGAGADAPGVRLEDLVERADPERARSVVEEIQREIDPDDVVTFQLSGGTTGVPKLIPRLHAEYWYNARVYAEARGWTRDSRIAHLIPIIHNAGITCGVHAAHAIGATLVLGTARLDEAMPLMARERATAILVGHAHYGMVDHAVFDDVADALEQVLLSGAKVPPRVFEAFERHGVAVGQKFGMGEGMFTITGFDWPRVLRLTTVGLPISPLDEVRVLDPDSEAEVADGEAGELAARGPYTIRGYFDAPEINATAFTADGFYRTGDLVNRGGEKISAEEVEGLLVKHPGVLAAAVVAMPDERLGERACAYLVARGEPLTMAEVQQHLQSLGVAKFKWPERLEWIDEMPKTPVGKLDKKWLRDDVAARQRAG